MSIGGKTLKNILTGLNVIILIFGLIFIVVGSVAKASPQGIDSKVAGSSIFLIVIGCILVLVSLIGCFGTYQSNFAALVLYSALLIFCLILTFIVLGVAFGYRNNKKFKNQVTGHVKDEMSKAQNDSIHYSIQKDNKCCGVDGPDDWKANPMYKLNPPPSCCPSEFPKCSFEQAFKKGCKDYYFHSYWNSLTSIGGVAAALSIVLFLALLVSLWFAFKIRAEYNTIQ